MYDGTGHPITLVVPLLSHHPIPFLSHEVDVHCRQPQKLRALFVRALIVPRFSAVVTL